MATVEFGPETYAELARRLGLPADTPAPVVEAEMVLRLDLDAELVREVDQVLWDEFAYLGFCGALGWDSS